MQGVFHVGISQKSEPPTKRPKRHRISLNCQSCKKRKIKCDRSNPCNNCVKYKQHCTYSDPTWSQMDEKGKFSVSRLDNIINTSTTNDNNNKELQTPTSTPESTNKNVQSQLLFLKEKINQIESTLNPSTSPPSINWNQYIYDPNNNPTYVGINPCLNQTEEINFYQGYQSVHTQEVTRRFNYGPFAWLSLLKKDPAMKQSWDYLKHAREDFKKKVVATNRDEEKVDDVDEQFRAKAIDRDGFDDLRLYKTKTSDIRSSRPKCTKFNSSNINKHGLSLGLTMYEGKIDRELKLIEKIKMVLPKQKVIWILISKFFLDLYPFMPILDETSFKIEMERILGKENHNDDQPTTLVIEKRLDFAYLGVMLIVIRLSYLSLFSNKTEQNQQNLNSTDPTLKYLLTNPININLIDIAQLCLNQFDIFRKPNLTVLQCSFLLRLYRMFAPEDGDGADGGDSQTFSGMLIQMGYSIGLNREPSSSEIKVDNIIRKIWFFMIINDLIQGYQYGNPLSINEKYYDTKLPFYFPGNENVKDVELEKHVVSTFAYFKKYHEKLLAILNVALDIKSSVKIFKLNELITEFELFLHDSYGTIHEMLSSEPTTYPFMKIMKCKNYINMKVFLTTIFLHLFRHYEQLHSIDYAFFYLKKMLSNLYGELFININSLINNNDKSFGTAPIADLILNPTVQNLIHRVSQINFAILIRVNSSIFKMKSNDSNHNFNLRNNHEYRLTFAKLSKIAQLLTKISESCTFAMSKLSRRYYHAWRITRAHTFVLKQIQSPEYYQTYKDNLVEFLPLSNEQLSEIICIIENALNQTPISISIDEFINDLEIDQLWMQIAYYNNPNQNRSPQNVPLENNMDGFVNELNDFNEYNQFNLNDFGVYFNDND